MLLTKLKKPEVVQPSKPKFLLSGESGVGKTFFALSFLKPVFIDVEKGGNRPQYQERLKASGGMYFGQAEGANDFNEVISLVKSLIIEKHEFQTLIIDSISHLYLTEASKAEERVGNSFGKNKKEANKSARRLLRYLDQLNMTVILIAHSIDRWEYKGGESVRIGTTFDFYAKTDYILDLWCEILKGGKNFLVRTSRIKSLPQGEVFPLSYDRFSELYGIDIIESESKPVELATPGQLKTVSSLIKVLNASQEQIGKWFKKCDVESFEEMTSKQIVSLIELMEKKILTVKGK